MQSKQAASAASSSGARKKKRQKNRGQGNNNLTESTSIRVSQILEQFRASNDQMYTFEADLTNTERASVHMLCKKMGLKSKSSGRGNQRRLSVFKEKKKIDVMKGRDKVTSFRFSEAAKDVLQDLFTQYPPNGDVDHPSVGGSGKIYNVRGKKDDTFRRPSLDTSGIAKKVESLVSKVEKNPNLKQIAEARSKLPITSFRDVITSTIDSHQVVLISGETGCGKTTQVPQFILDHVWGKSETCKIVCTQPRRISAISVAERISTERGENVGDTVGYKIRMESSGGRHSSIVFCTNGILLRVLVAKGNGGSNTKAKGKMAKDELSEITHILVDEIHERDRYSDFMLAIIRDLLPSYPHLRLVLMSATIDAERFSKYFGGCPIIRVPGFTYPVKTFYLEDVLSIIKSTEKNHLDCSSKSAETEESTLTEEYRVALDEAISLALSNDELDSLLELISSKGGSKVFNYQHSSTGVTPLMVLAKKGSIGDICMLLSLGADCNLRANDGTTALDWARGEGHKEAVEIIKKHMEKSFSTSEEQQELLDKYLSNVDPELIDDVLIEQLLNKICTDSNDGAILVFLPGWDDINRTRERLETSSFFKNSSKFLIIVLHSMIPSMEQKKVFKRPPPGCRKIVLSTNIAETAITIDDVVYVIDTGRMKEKSYDPYNNVSTLQSSWISKASAKQREGRAGRCQPGICYHLYSRLRASSLPDFQVPEIKRIPIEELCLQVKLINPDYKIEDFLRKTLDPPVFETIRNAIIVLQDIGALSLDEELTELGEKVGSLPVHPLTSKMLLIAILLNCLDPALTLACASDYRDPFTLPMLPHEKKRADAARAELASFYGGRSDQLAVVAAFECWKIAKEKGQETRFCSTYFVSSGTMRMISLMRKQLQSELFRNGFILNNNDASYSLNARDPGILHAVLVAGLYPMVGRLLPPLKGGKKAVVETAGGDKVRLHPHSTNFKLSFKKFDDQPLIMYGEITRGEWGMNIKKCSIVGPLQLLLLATEIAVAPANESDDDEDEDDESDYEDADEDECDNNKLNTENASDVQHGAEILSSPHNIVKVVVDRWLYFESAALDVAQIYCLRESLAAAILFKVKHPGKDLPETLGASLYAIACILSYDGMTGISSLLGHIDSLTAMVGAADIGQSEPGNQKGFNPGPNSFLKSLIGHGGHRASLTHYQQGGILGSPVMNWNGPSNYQARPSFGVRGGNLYQRPLSQGPSAFKAGCSKRPRGNGS